MRTEYFKNGLLLSEAAAGEVEVGFSAEATRLLLCFVYTGTLDKELVGSDRDVPAPELLLELLQEADYYGIPALCARVAGLLALPGVVPSADAAAPGSTGLLLAMLTAARSVADPAGARVREVAFERIRQGKAAFLASGAYRSLAEGAGEGEGGAAAAAASRRLLTDVVAALAQLQG